MITEAYSQKPSRQTMKLIKKSIISGFMLSISINTFAQDCPVVFLGTKTLYQKPIAKLTEVPAKYKLVFINYVGRHGARHLTKEVNSYQAYQLLIKADSLHVLTEKGQALKQQVLNLENVEKGNVKFISAEGKAELQGIGERMVKQNPELFKQSAKIKVSVTKEIRTLQSADAFFIGINLATPNKLIIDKVTDDTNLRFYDFSPAYDDYKDGDLVEEKLKTLQQKEQINLINKAFAARIFKPVFAEKLTPNQTEKFTTDVFGFATVVYSLQTEIRQDDFKPADLNFKAFFTCEELAHLGLMDAAEDYLQKGPGLDLNGIQVKIAVPLLINFIKTTDEFIATGKYHAQLRFAHAETISPFATLLGISSANKTVTDLSKLNQYWQPEKIAPLSSNIQWVLYKQEGAKKYLVKVLLNEKEVYIDGLTTKTFPFYNWNDVTDFYQKKLSGWHLNLDADMILYLKNLSST